MNQDIYYAKSDKIAVFPFTGDRKSYYNGRVLTEQNISLIISKLANRDEYVISCQYETEEGIESVSYIEFMIHGHYFKLSDSKILEKRPLYASITLDDSFLNFQTLSGQDFQEEGSNTYKFTGVAFQDADPEESAYKLQLLDEFGKVPTDSWFRFTNNVIKNINGGIV